MSACRHSGKPFNTWMYEDTCIMCTVRHGEYITMKKNPLYLVKEKPHIQREVKDQLKITIFW